MNLRAYTLPTAAFITACLSLTAAAQSVCLPAPRLMTTMPMGGAVGTTFDVTITGQNIDDAELLSFSHPGITAAHKLKSGIPVPGRYVITIDPDCPPGVHEARVMTRLGVSTSRAFNVGTLPEATRTTANTTLETAMPLELNTVCNATMTKQAVDYFSFKATKDQRIVVDCAARNIDSKLTPVIVVADKSGADLVVERRGGTIDFTAPADGTYVVKVHDLTYNGGPYHFYRLVLRSPDAGVVLQRPAGTRTVSSFSWPPAGMGDASVTPEREPNNTASTPQKITLPCDISGSFFPAADVDSFQFTAKKGEVWWVEVASERFGLNTDPAVVVQHVATVDGKEQLTDVAEFSDIASPVKVSSNGYSYDGPPYNAGSTDIIGKLEIKQDGVHRLQLSDLFGGTRSNPRNIYRLIIRKAAPDFAIVGWALHMNLRNGDRNALSKPLTLRRGATMAVEVVTVRRDGFNGEIHLQMDNLPPGVTAHGLKIPAGQSRGIVLLTATEDASRGVSQAGFTGRAMIGGKEVVRTGYLASMAWPVPNAWSEVPAPRLLADVPVSVCDTELTPITIATTTDKPLEVIAGEKLTIPLVHTRRCKFSGANISLKAFGDFSKTPAFAAPLTKDNSQVVLDTKQLKTKPGEYVLAFYGKAVANYRYNPEAVAIADAALKRAQKRATELDAQAKKLAKAVQSATADTKAAAKKASAAAKAAHKAATAAVRTADRQLKAVQKKAAPKDIVDIVVTKPVTVRVKPAEKK